MRKATATFTLSCLAVVLALSFCVSNAFAAPETYTKHVQPLGNGYGIANLVETEASTDPYYINRMVSGSGISSAFASGNDYRVNGAILDFGDNPAISYTANDIIGFYFTYNPSTPDTLNVWRNLIGNIMETQTSSNIRSFGFGGVTNASGLVAFRMDGYSGGIGGNGIGILNVDAPTTTTFMNYNDTTYYSLMGGSTSASTWTVPAIGQNQNIMVSSCFDSYLGAFRSSFTGQGGNLNPHGIYLTGTGLDHRGSPAINDAAKVIAAVTESQAGQTYNYGEWFNLRVITYTDNGTTFTKQSENVYNFRNIGDGHTYAFANFFSTSAYRGPQQISINDHGDIAFPVVIDVVGNQTSDFPYRSANRRGIMFMSHLTPGTFKLVVDNVTSPSLFYDPSFAPCISGVAIDNDCNIYFAGCNWMGIWNSDIVSTNAIYKASANSSTNPTSWSVEPIIWRGMTWKDGSEVCQLTYLPTGNSGSEYYANPASFMPQSINRTKIPGMSGEKFSVGGIFFGAGISVDGTDGQLMRGLYVAPTQQTASTTTIAQALQLADGEPINLYDCVITALAGAYVPDATEPDRIYYRYIVSDSKMPARLAVSTIRSDLQIGDRVHASGFMSTNEDSTDEFLSVGERFLTSGGLVLLERNVEHKQPFSMSNKAIGSSYGLSTIGMWVRAFGKVQSINTIEHYLMITDGSGNDMRVNYGGCPLPSGLSVGNYISLTGDVASDSPKVINMRGNDGTDPFVYGYQDEITKY